MTERAYHHGDLKNALIRAGVDIIARDGLHGLSLRQVARQAGVSHAAPYAHFADKQALIAAIATEGHKQLHERMVALLERFPGEPLRQLAEIACAYGEFGLEEPELFYITFSGVLERERDYPALVEIAALNYALVRDLVVRCQAAGILDPGEPDVATFGVWGLVHGCVSLVQRGQVPHAVLDRYSLRELLIAALGRITHAAPDPAVLPEASTLQSRERAPGASRD
jgi:AcrR family transcriptional regulator